MQMRLTSSSYRRHRLQKLSEATLECMSESGPTIPRHAVMPAGRWEAGDGVSLGRLAFDGESTSRFSRFLQGLSTRSQPHSKSPI
jgi:hypothetical protein